MLESECPRNNVLSALYVRITTLDSVAVQLSVGINRGGFRHVQHVRPNRGPKKTILCGALAP